LERRRKLSILIICLIVVSSGFAFSTNRKVEAFTPFFMLKYKAYIGDPYLDYANLIQLYLKRIGIEVNIIAEDWGAFLDTLMGSRDFDLTCIGFGGGGIIPEGLPLSAYTENGSLNCFGYDTSMDWDEDLGTGLNEWLIQEIANFNRPLSQEKIDHYWNWQNNLMDELCPLLPMFAPLSRTLHFNNLIGYDYNEGLVDSWGKLRWNGLHPGQQSLDEVVITDYRCSYQNPFFYADCPGQHYLQYVLDPLIKWDGDLSLWPHLVKEWEYLADNHLQFTLREGIKWQNDPDNNFTNEYFDAEDVYFTLYCWKHVSVRYNDWYFVDDFYIVDDNTIDIILDTSGNGQVSPQHLYDLSTWITPEHYLNQTQLADGITPDITHLSWLIYDKYPFGTKLFQLKEETDVDATFEFYPDSWWFNESLTSDPALNWVERFGTFEHSPSEVRLRFMVDAHKILYEFQQGRVDIVGYNHHDYLDDWIEENDIVTQYDTTNFYNWLGYNMRETRGPIGSREPAPFDSSITKGLAIRKAISYAIDRSEINDVVHFRDELIHQHPNYPTLGHWLNPDIKTYDFNLNVAKAYMLIAGYDCGQFEWPSDFFVSVGVNSYYYLGLLGLAGIALALNKRKKR
jgi:ABC-type transport system substrate-binding protein